MFEKGLHLSFGGEWYIHVSFNVCDRVCLNNLNHAFQSYLHAIINDIVTSDMLCQSDNTFVLVKIYTWSLINDLMTTCDMLKAHIYSPWCHVIVLLVLHKHIRVVLRRPPNNSLSALSSGRVYVVVSVLVVLLEWTAAAKIIKVWLRDETPV